MSLFSKSARWFSGKVVKAFGLGLITIIPFVTTVGILWWGFTRIDNILQPLISRIWGHPIPGMGFAISLVVILIVGIGASNVLGKRIIYYIELAIPFMPIFRWIYTGVKQIVDSFTGMGHANGMKPVITEFPKKGMYVIGFITKEMMVDDETVYAVFVPTAPNPTSGFLQIIPQKDVHILDIPMDDALKMIISAGRVIPDEFAQDLSRNKYLD